MEKFHLRESALLKTIAVRIKNNDEMVNFYKNIIGFILKNEENGLSIFGSLKPKSELLILEEDESLLVSGEENSAFFSIYFNSEGELADTIKRISEKEYPIEKAVRRGKRTSFYVEDPEKNKIELFYQPDGVHFAEATSEKNIEIEKFIKKAEGKHPSLSETTRISQADLAVLSKGESIGFYESILGMPISKSQELTIGDGNSFFTLLEEKKQLKERRIGFLVIQLKEAKDIEALMEHLQAKEKEFYVDNKRSLLTIFDQDGIEWWFTTK